MARIAQPRELAELKGAHKRNPQRYKKKPPKNNDKLGKPPKHMDAYAKKVWAELETYALPGVLTGSERFIFEIVSNLIAEYRMGPNIFPIGKYSHLLSGLSKLGLTPADRQKLGVTKDKEDENEFDMFD